MNRTSPLLPVCVVALGLAAALTAGAAAPPPSASGLDLAGLDRSVRPGDDFFRYANGSWMAANEIPPDRSSWGSAEILDDLTRKRTADLIQSAGKGAAPGSEGY